MANDELAEALAGGGMPSGGDDMPRGGPQGGMAPQQAVQILQQLGITPQNLPMVAQAIQTVMAAQGGGGAQPGPPAPNGPPPMGGPQMGPPGGGMGGGMMRGPGGMPPPR